MSNFDFDNHWKHHVSAKELDTPQKVAAILDHCTGLLNAATVAARPFIPDLGSQADNYASKAFHGRLSNAWSDAYTARQMLLAVTLVAELLDLLREPMKALEAVS